LVRKRIVVIKLAFVLPDSRSLGTAAVGALGAYTRSAKMLERASDVNKVMNGIDLAIRVRNNLPNCKILLFSGQATIIDLLEKARAQGYSCASAHRPGRVEPRVFPCPKPWFRFG
jgi:hypothetical protein